MARKKQTEMAQDKRRAKVAAMYLRGMRQIDIAAELKVTQGTISKDLMALHEQWKAAQLFDIDAAKALELNRLAEIEREAWSAWERSKLDAVAKRRKYTEDGIEREVTRKGQAGDPRFLERVSWCIDRRCKLLGLDAPTKSENKHIHSGEVFLTKEQMLSEVRDRLSALAAATKPSKN